MKNPIICISREFGSGGRMIAREVADALQLPFYDRNIIDEAAQASGLSAEFIEREEQRFDNSMLFSMSMGTGAVTAAGLALPNQVFKAESEVIRSLAEKGGCVIVGRCADFVLRENPNMFSVFICADFDFRVKRAIREAHLPENSAAKIVKSKDKQRARHYRFYTDMPWGERSNYDMILNSSRLGYNACVDLICKAVEGKE